MKDYTGLRSLRALIRACWAELDDRVKFSDIINHTSSASDKKVLSANMGKVLHEKIKSIDSNEDGIVNNSELLEGHPASYFAKDGDAAMLITTMMGNPDGLCPLDANGQVSSEFLPSYVDDVIECYVDTQHNKLYSDPARLKEIIPERGKIYISLDGGDKDYSYRWGGSKLVEITSSDMVEITEEAIVKLWNQVKNQVHNSISGIQFHPNGTNTTIEAYITCDDPRGQVTINILNALDEEIKTLFVSVGVNTLYHMNVPARIDVSAIPRVAKIQIAVTNSDTNEPLSEIYLVDVTT